MERLRNIRERAGYSQQDLADESGVGQHTISEIELGRRRPQGRTLRKLAGVLGVEVADFYGTAPYPEVPAPPDPTAGERRDFDYYRRLQNLDRDTLEAVEAEDYATYARLDAEWRAAAADDPSSGRAAALASQVDIAHFFALMASFERYRRENPDARFTPVPLEVRAEIEHELTEMLR